MSRKEWSKTHTFNLIALYRHHRLLWDPKHIEFRNREKKNKALNEIGVKFKCSGDEIQRKIHNLRNQMSQELKKTRNRIRNGNEIDEAEISSWCYYEAMKFLAPILKGKVVRLSPSQALKIISEAASETRNISDCERKLENEDSLKKIIMPRKRKRIDENEDEDEDDHDPKPVSKGPYKEFDEDDQFGQHVALELKTLKSQFNKARLKSEIRKIIARIADEDLYSHFSNSTSSVSLQSPGTFQVEGEINGHASHDYIKSYNDI